MGKIKYSEEMKLQTVKYVLEGGKSATKVSKELGIDTNTVCRWVREYREANQMPSYEAEQRIRRQSADQMAYGCRKMKVALQEEGVSISEWKIRRIMKENGLYPKTEKNGSCIKRQKVTVFIVKTR